MNIIFTSHPHAAQDAARELSAAFPKGGKIQWLEEGVGLIDLPADSFQEISRTFLRRPVVFVRHIFPVLRSLPSQGDPLSLLEEIAACLDCGRSFSVQARAPGFGPGALSRALQERGFALDIAHPGQAVSVLRCGAGCYVGVSDTADNLSDWNGGMMHFREEGAISRAEFKLLEALRTFRIDVACVRSALDMGAAPGGWSKVLAELGVPSVTAVDPAALDPRLSAYPAVRHFHGTALEFQRNHPDEPFDLITNDMKMDARLSLEMLLSFRPQLREGGLFLATIKLPRQRPADAAHSALAAIRQQGELLWSRQLFHNRSEITAVFR